MVFRSKQKYVSCLTWPRKPAACHRAWPESPFSPGAASPAACPAAAPGTGPYASQGGDSRENALLTLGKVRYFDIMAHNTKTQNGAVLLKS